MRISLRYYSLCLLLSFGMWGNPGLGHKVITQGLLTKVRLVLSVHTHYLIEPLTMLGGRWGLLTIEGTGAF